MENNKTANLKELKEDYYPSSYADENYILACMFYSLETAERVIEMLTAEDFYNQFNRDVFKICKELTVSRILVTAHSINQEYLRLKGEEFGFDDMDITTLQMRYKAETILTDKSALSGAIKRVQVDTQYREIIYRAKDALLMAQTREGLPIEIASPLETLSIEFQQDKRSVITWMRQAEEEAQETYTKLDEGRIVAYPTGFPEIDEKLYGGGFWDGDFIIVAGATSGGKTTFALNIAANQAAIGKKVLIFSLEMKTFKLFSRIHSAKSKVPGYKIRPNMSEIYGKEVRERLRSTGSELANLPIGLIDSVKDMETIRRISKWAVREEGVDEIIIDYLGLATPKKGFKGSPYERARLNSELGKELALEISKPVIALSQLRRKYKEEKGAAGTAKGNEVEPELDMLKNAGDIENDADTVIFLWGEKEEEGEQKPISDIKGKVDKQRNGELFKFDLKFAKDIFHFTSIRKMEIERANLLQRRF